MQTGQRGLLAMGLSAGGLRAARAAARPVIKLGISTATSGPFKDLGGPNVEVCVRQAVRGGQALHPAHLFQVRSLAESRAPFDDDKLVASTAWTRRSARLRRASVR